jgi:hypothetical protein
MSTQDQLKRGKRMQLDGEKRDCCFDPGQSQYWVLGVRNAGKLEILWTLPQRDMRGARALDALGAFISQRRQI